MRRRRMVLKKRLRDQFLKRMPQNSICAEIGVWKGNFSCQILRVVQPVELHLIDPWDVSLLLKESADRQWRRHQIITFYHNTRLRFKNQPSVRLHRATSQEVLPSFPDGYFDWIYVDGGHDYATVFSDLELSWNKVKLDGLIAGDDYTGRSSREVREAVNDFVSAYDIRHELEIVESQFLIRKVY